MRLNECPQGRPDFCRYSVRGTSCDIWASALTQATQCRHATHRLQLQEPPAAWPALSEPVTLARKHCRPGRGVCSTCSDPLSQRLLTGSFSTTATQLNDYPRNTQSSTAPCSLVLQFWTDIKECVTVGRVMARRKKGKVILWKAKYIQNWLLRI